MVENATGEMNESLDQMFMIRETSYDIEIVVSTVFQVIQWSFHDRTRLHQANVVVSDARELLLTLEKSLAI